MVTRLKPVSENFHTWSVIEQTEIILGGIIGITLFENDDISIRTDKGQPVVRKCTGLERLMAIELFRLKTQNVAMELAIRNVSKIIEEKL